MSINATIAVPYFVMKDYLTGSWPHNRISAMSRNFDRLWIISITNPITELREDGLFPLFQDAEDRIALQFHDIDSEDCDAKTIPFNKEMADKVVKFLRMANKGESNDLLVVNCHAGISRSGAVSFFARSVFGIDYSMWKRQNPQVIPNALVLELLFRAWGNSANSV